MCTRLLLLLAAAAALAPGSAAGQDRSRSPLLSRAEILRSGASDAYAVVAQLRPAWLGVVGDTLAGDGFGELIVYLDGRHAGDVRLLRTLEAERVAAIRYVSADHVRSVDPRYPRARFAAALWVSTRTPAEQAQLRPWSAFTVYGVAPIGGLPSAIEGGLRRAGWSEKAIFDERRHLQGVKPSGPEYSPGIGANAAVGLTRTLGVEVQAEYVPRAWIGRFNLEDYGAVSTTFSWADVVVMGTFRNWPGRFGVGPVVRAANWRWASGRCGCTDPESSASLGYGVAGSGGASIPVGRAGVVEVRVGLRHFFSHEVDGYAGVPALDLTGTEGLFSLGFGLQR